MSRPIAKGLAFLAVTAALLLAACVVAPGKFDATLDLRKDGRFSFTYTGQIFLVALGNYETASRPSFTAQPCQDDSLEDRACTDDEIAEQRAEWDAGAEQRRQQSEQEMKSMKAMLGGIDPSDPRAAEELAARLRRQAGWKRVDYRGDGLFDVEFALTSRLGHDFVFPTFEQFPVLNAFLTAHLRDTTQVRIEAPGFASQSAADNPFKSMMAGAIPGGEEGGKAPTVPELDGTFRIVTDGKILANNTDEGPRPSPLGQVLEWKVNARTSTAPTALIALGG